VECSRHFPRTRRGLRHRGWPATHIDHAKTGSQCRRFRQGLRCRKHLAGETQLPAVACAVPWGVVSPRRLIGPASSSSVSRPTRIDLVLTDRRKKVRRSPEPPWTCPERRPERVEGPATLIRPVLTPWNGSSWPWACDRGRNEGSQAAEGGHPSPLDVVLSPPLSVIPTECPTKSGWSCVLSRSNGLRRPRRMNGLAHSSETVSLHRRGPEDPGKVSCARSPYVSLPLCRGRRLAAWHVWSVV